MNPTPRLVGVQYATGEPRDIALKGMEAVKKKYCIGTWNVRTKNQGKLEVVE